MKIAIMIDGAFFLRRAPHFWGMQTPHDLAEIMYKYCQAHVKQCIRNADLYRIFFYDCPPATIRAQHPVTKENIDFSKSDKSQWRIDFHNELKKKRKVALRLGHLDETNPNWVIRGKAVKKLCNGAITHDQLDETDVVLDWRQKGVDMRIGLDIASVTFKKQAEQIILISGDSDFVPAAKLARREGIDFVLDPMWLQIKDDLFEHIDGLQTQVYKPIPGIINGNIKIWPNPKYSSSKGRKLVTKK